MEKRDYVHGYSAKEGGRLVDQVTTLTEGLTFGEVSGAKLVLVIFCMAFFAPFDHFCAISGLG
jgi:hypothetical protein